MSSLKKTKRLYRLHATVKHKIIFMVQVPFQKSYAAFLLLNHKDKVPGFIIGALFCVSYNSGEL